MTCRIDLQIRGDQEAAIELECPGSSALPTHKDAVGDRGAVGDGHLPNRCAKEAADIQVGVGQQNLAAGLENCTGTGVDADAKPVERAWQRYQAAASYVEHAGTAGTAGTAVSKKHIAC